MWPHSKRFPSRAAGVQLGDGVLRPVAGPSGAGPLGHSLCEVVGAVAVESRQERLRPWQQPILAYQPPAGIGVVVATAVVVGTALHGVTVHAAAALEAAEEALEDVGTLLPGRLPTALAVVPVQHALDGDPGRPVDQLRPLATDQLALLLGAVDVGHADVADVAQDLRDGVLAPAAGEAGQPHALGIQPACDFASRVVDSSRCGRPTIWSSPGQTWRG